jgi:hypothetical protein
VSLVDGRRIAIEVELLPKAPRRLRAILAGYDDAIQRGQFTWLSELLTSTQLAEPLQMKRTTVEDYARGTSCRR